MNVANAAEPEPRAAKPKPRVRALDALTAEQRVFVKTLNDEMKKFNAFFMNAEEDLVMRERVLATRFHELVDKKTGKLSAAKHRDAKNRDDAKDVSESAARELRETRRAFADFHGELVLMEHWTSLNYTALVKILKKHDKRSSLRLRSPVLASALQQPFYSTEVLTELIKKTESRFRVLHALASETEAAAREKNGAREPREKNAAPSRLATTPAALARTRAAISCWDGMKHEDSVKRPFGDISASAEHPAPASKKVRA
jgi:SPX domain protein involved in polyphosphate accumulation